MVFLEIIKAIVYGLVQAITEWLPISSTGHLILLEEWMPLKLGATAAETSDFFSLFIVTLHLGSILAVVVNFWPELWPFSLRKNALKRNPDLDQSDYFSCCNNQLLLNRSQLTMWLKILLACVPAAIVGLFFQDYFEALFYNPYSVAIALIVVGVFFILVENFTRNKKPECRSIAEISWRAAFIIGLFQVIAAIFPGTSRSGITILAGLIIGLSRPLAAKFTFYLAVPVMIGANILKLSRYDGSLTILQFAVIIIGALTAFIASLLVIRALLKYIRKNNFKPFAYYRIALGALVILSAALGWI